MDPITYVKQNEHDQADEIFVRTLEEIAKKISEKFKVSVPLIFDKAAKELHESQNESYACGKKFHRDKVRDHCHYTGRYRGALHSKFNLI